MVTCLLGVKQLTITALNVRHIWLLPFFTSVPFQSGFYGLLLQFYFPLLQYGRTHLSREHILPGNTSLLLLSGYCTRAQMTTYPAKEELRRACTLGGVCLSRKMLLFLWKERRGAGDKPGFSGFPVIIFKKKPLSSCSGYALVNTVEEMADHVPSCLNINLKSYGPHLTSYKSS